ncbi:MAG: PIG-L family deacetylase, partial [Candidatus Limnocylindria bacterium]
MSSIWRPVRERNPARSLMVVVAHPGDEAFGFAGAITDAVAAGAYVVVVCATRGFFDPRLLDKAPAPGGRNRSYAKPVVWRNIDNVREDEMRRSVALLGVRVLRMLDYAEDTLDKVDFDELVSRIVEPIRMHRPEVLITFGPDGVTGDRDHQAICRAVDLAFDAAGRPLSYEDDLEEDQAAWRCAKLYHLVLPAEKVALLGDAAPDELRTLDVSRPTLHLELGELAVVKLAAINRHVSQTGSSGAFADWTPEVRDRFLASEDYRLVRSNLPVAA